MTFNTALLLTLLAMTIALISLKLELNKFREQTERLLTAFSIIAINKAKGTKVYIGAKGAENEPR